jgi:hypothetical protein
MYPVKSRNFEISIAFSFSVPPIQETHNFSHLSSNFANFDIIYVLVLLSINSCEFNEIIKLNKK